MGILGILIALFGLMYLAYRGVNVLILAPIMALVACLFHPGTPLLASYTQVFMPALGNYLLQYFPIFLLGSVFGKLMSDSGAAYSISNFITKKIGSKHAILAVVLSCALLTYGGVSLFVVAFTIYPVALNLFHQASIPRRLIPGSIALGSFTFTMTAIPGTPAIQNAIPMPVFGTTAFAAPLLGILATLVMGLFGYLWLSARAVRAQNEPWDQDEQKQVVIPESYPHIALAILPLFLVLVLNYIFSHNIFPNLDTSYLAEPKFGNTTAQKVVGLWSLIAALTISLIVAFFVLRKSTQDKTKVLNDGTFGSMLPIFNTASEVGFGAVVASLASFEIIKSALTSLSPEYPLISLSVAINALAGITGSASGGLSIALNALGQTFVEMAAQTGVSLEVMHRVAAVACGGLDTLPHNGAVITLLTICGLTHKKSYLDVFMTCVVGTVLANVVIVIAATLLPSVFS